MKLEMFSIYDSKATAFLQPFFSLSAGTAIREFSDAANSTDHEFNRHAEDYTLFHLGTFDQGEGEFTLSAVPISLGLAAALLNPEHNNVTPIAGGE